jgi:hypothetical protein
LGGRGRQISEFEASLIFKSEFQDSQGYTEKPRLERKKQTNEQIKTSRWRWGKVESGAKAKF